MKFWFSRIGNRDDALRLIGQSSTLFFGLAGLQIAALLFLLTWTPSEVRFYVSSPTDFVIDAVGTAIIITALATILRIFNSRVAAVMLVLLFMVIAANFISNRMNKTTSGNAALAILGVFVAVRSTYAAFKLHGQFASEDKTDRRVGHAKPYDVEKWQTLLKHDKEIALVTEKLRPLGERWVDQFAHDFLALNDKRYLLEIAQRIIADARDVTERADRARQDWHSGDIK
jgi:hypothetical protein